MHSEHSQTSDKILNTFEEFNSQEEKIKGGSWSLNFQESLKALTWTWREVKSLLLSQGCVLERLRWRLHCKMVLRDLHLWKGGEEAGVDRGWRRLGLAGVGSSSWCACLRLGQPSRVLWVKIACRKPLVVHKWLGLYTSPATHDAYLQDADHPRGRHDQGPDSSQQRRCFPKGADSWRLSAGHAPRSWAERPSLKKDLGSASLSITIPEAKLVLSAAQGFPAAQSPQAGPALPGLSGIPWAPGRTKQKPLVFPCVVPAFSHSVSDPCYFLLLP